MIERSTISLVVRCQTLFFQTVLIVIVASSSPFTARSTLADVGFSRTSAAASVWQLVRGHLETFGVDLVAFIWTHAVVVAFVVVLLAKSLLKLIDFKGAPLVLRAVVFNQLVKTSITLCWCQMASTFSVFCPTYSPLRCINRATMFTYRRFTPLCLGRNTSSVSVEGRVLC